MSTATSTLHVTPAGSGEWAVKINESAGASSVHPDRAQAIGHAWELLKDRDDAEVLVHDDDGRVRSTLTIRQVGPPVEVLQTSAQGEDLDDGDDPADRAEALRITPSNDRLRAMIGKFPLPPGDYGDEELPC